MESDSQFFLSKQFSNAHNIFICFGTYKLEDRRHTYHGEKYAIQMVFWLKKRSYNIETLGKCVQRIVEITDDGMISTYFYFPKYTS